MHEAVRKMLDRYACRSLDDHLRAVREIIQEIALLGLWRARFFEHAALYGGTALRILHGGDRFSEDLDFTLLRPDHRFRLSAYLDGLAGELRAFGFDTRAESVTKSARTPVQSAFLKSDTRSHLLTIAAGEGLLRVVPRGQLIKVKLEVDTDPPGDFDTRAVYLLQPIPFPVRACVLPDLFAGKMHAALFRRWRSRVKGRDWYDLLWFAAHHPDLHLAHLEQRMRQSGHWAEAAPLTEGRFRELLTDAIAGLDVTGASGEVRPFVRDQAALDAWSRDLFHQAAARIRIV